MKALIFDPFAGIAGDMILGALVDLGLEPEWLSAFVAGLGLEGVGVETGRADRRGIRCGTVRFELPRQHEHRHLRHVVEIIERAPVSDAVRARSSDVFRRIAEAEAAIHGTTVEKVHFHEVGALDSILDVLCGMAGMERLGYETFYYRPIAIGTGTVAIKHGRYPVPAPATARLLEGYAVRETGFEGECTTPTGAALLTALTEGKRVPADVLLGRAGYGAGTRDPEDRPNCLRLIECRVGGSGDGAMVVVQADVDDMSAEYVPAAQQALLEAGARDATVLRIDMKKGRPGLRFEALTDEASLPAVIEALYRSTSTIGLRHWRVERPVLERNETVIEWRGHRIGVKQVRLSDGTVRSKPEYDDVVRAARAEGMPPLEVRAAVERIVRDP
ncbi:MAG TPA: nickel pincer cofactor biosynthesis protein LarC [Longimicrobiales bacterium]|nr:nickel pincer cofactor biosynthesis protein LarC [Longimicrobiales bacterium]